MRLDLFLKKTRLLKQRPLAKRFCDEGAVLVNGRPAKPSQSVRAGDRIRLQLPRRRLEVRVLDVPAGNVARGTTSTRVEVLADFGADRIARVFEEPDGMRG
jgi:ribosomal 50S subunit-recycling heat shock protein